MLVNFDSNTPLDGHPSRAPVVLAVMIPVYIIALILVAMRVLVKGKLRKLGVEDVFIVIATCAALALVVFTIIGRNYGFGRHTTDIPPDWIVPYTRNFFIIMNIGTICHYFTRASILFFYLTLATEPYLRKTVYAILTFVSISSTVVFFIGIFGCTPISGSWDPSQRSVCITGIPFYYYSAGINIPIDIVLLLLPIPILLRLRLGWKVKFGLAMMFSMGFLVTGAAIAHFWALSRSMTGGDVAWDGAYTWMYGFLELNVGIITACMPAMKLFHKWMSGGEQTVPHDGGDGTIGGGRRKVGAVEWRDQSLWSFRSERPGAGEKEQHGAVRSQEVLLANNV